MTFVLIYPILLFTQLNQNTSDNRILHKNELDGLKNYLAEYTTSFRTGNLHFKSGLPVDLTDNVRQYITD